MDTLFSMKDIFEILKKSWLWILSFAVSGLLIAASLAYVIMTPIFEMNSQVIVSQIGVDQSAISQNAEVQANLQLVNTYRVLITSPRVLSEVANKMDNVYSVSDLTKKITVSTEQDSQVINITAKDENPKVAAEISNQAAIAFKKITPKVMQVDNVNVLSEAKSTGETGPISPKPLLIMALGLFGGALMGVVIAFMRNLLSNKFKEEKDLDILGVPLLGSIGKLPERNFGETKEGRSRK
ncbi:hypothetical protein UE46_00770 [Listeria weihenstephanensis]|uniref:Polysaccharide chain length determinant N-terminal domain-containing protein n=2 Tax=Listeria weihenstephanensis TaxID=1006155 RepID=A0A1S7FYF5_9LIST|nr:Wzz/FepE/Etk N-terminal domain-containing protein [Listeria weihenstephanensis]AQY52405.1 hypothetical protein UE46_00770 [Listeria weihenstephanensis]